MDISFKYDCNLDIESFVHMLDDPTECYKFYWLDSIMTNISEGKFVFSFDDTISGMIADAWYSVKGCHLKLGPRNSDGSFANGIERAIDILDGPGSPDADAGREIVFEYIKRSGKEIHDIKYQLSKNVPYRIFSSFFTTIGGNDRIWDQRSRLITYMYAINKTNCLPYLIGDEKGLSRTIRINSEWDKFFQDNMISIKGWIQMKKLQYLQRRNPDIPGIINKLSPGDDKKRKLENVRKLWAAVMYNSCFTDIYTGDRIDVNDFEIDHFIPWSFVSNDELWNLIPTTPASNSRKKDRLPNWNYYELFTKKQYELNNSIYQNQDLYILFNNCRRDNLNSIWSLNDLYIKGIGYERFYHVLIEKMKPLYDSAHLIGYEIW